MITTMLASSWRGWNWVSGTVYLLQWQCCLVLSPHSTWAALRSSGTPLRFCTRSLWNWMETNYPTKYKFSKHYFPIEKSRRAKACLILIFSNNTDRGSGGLTIPKMEEVAALSLQWRLYQHFSPLASWSEPVTTPSGPCIVMMVRG